MQGGDKLYYSIAEASEKLSLPKYVLRFWESKFYQISPMKRAGGRRFYRTEDMQLLQLIKYLLHEKGMTIKGAQGLLRERSLRDLFDGEGFEEGAVNQHLAPVQAKDDTSLQKFLNDLLNELVSIRKIIN